MVRSDGHASRTSSFRFISIAVAVIAGASSGTRVLTPVGLALGGWIAQHWSYRIAFLALGSVAVLSLVPWLLHGRRAAVRDAIA